MRRAVDPPARVSRLPRSVQEVRSAFDHPADDVRDRLDEQHQHDQDPEDDRNRTSEEVAEIIAADQHAPEERALDDGAKDDTQDQRDQRVVVFPHDEADDPEDEHQPDVEHTAPHRKRTDHCQR